MRPRIILALTLITVLASGCAPGLRGALVGEARPVAAWSDDFNNVSRDGDIIFAGRPTTEGLYKAAGEGVTVVVDLISDGEKQRTPDFDEKAIVERLGMRYVAIPVTPDTFSASQVDEFADVLGSTGGPVLVHCSSSNRSGGIWAAYLVRHRGFSLDDALARGRKAGLSRDSMVEAVRRVSAPPEPATRPAAPVEAGK